MRKDTYYTKGQSLVEILIAMGISAILIGGVVSLYVTSLRTNMNTRLSAIGTQLAQETYGNVKALAEADWFAVYSVAKGTSQHLIPSGPPLDTFSIASGTEIREVGGTRYTRAFTIENVQREMGGDIVFSGGINDPSTQRVTVTVSWPIFGGTDEIRTIGYITRSKNISFPSTNWIDGSGHEGAFIGQTSGFSASSNIDHLTIPGAIRLLNF